MVWVGRLSSSMGRDMFHLARTCPWTLEGWGASVTVWELRDSRSVRTQGCFPVWALLCASLARLPSPTEAVLGFLVTWNTNSRNCHEAQAVMETLLKHEAPDTLLQFSGIKSAVESLLPYTGEALWGQVRAGGAGLDQGSWNGLGWKGQVS